MNEIVSERERETTDGYLKRVEITSNVKGDDFKSYKI